MHHSDEKLVVLLMLGVKAFPLGRAFLYQREFREFKEFRD
jgi:hypothetical protein